MLLGDFGKIADLRVLSSRSTPSPSAAIDEASPQWRLALGCARRDRVWIPRSRSL